MRTIRIERELRDKILKKAATWPREIRTGSYTEANCLSELTNRYVKYTDSESKLLAGFKSISPVFWISGLLDWLDLIILKKMSSSGDILNCIGGAVSRLTRSKSNQIKTIRYLRKFFPAPSLHLLHGAAKAGRYKLFTIIYDQNMKYTGKEEYFSHPKLSSAMSYALEGRNMKIIKFILDRWDNFKITESLRKDIIYTIESALKTSTNSNRSRIQAEYTEIMNQFISKLMRTQLNTGLDTVFSLLVKNDFRN